jgi:YidC/Oxa1 family membrane protein insertase
VILPLAHILQPLIDVAEAFLKLLHDDVGLGWGVAIIILTFVTRIVILPLSITQIRSMRALQAYQPQIKEIQERYKDDRQRMQRELMAFYQENKINPLASCLPLLLQLPVFLSLFALLRSSGFKEDLHAPGSDPSFLGIPDLAEKATDSALIILIVLYFVTFVASIAITATQTEGAQRMIMFALPVIFTPLIINFPTGLIVYWIATNVWTIGQQGVIKQFFPPPPKPTPEEIKASRPPPPPPRKRKRRR